MDPVRTKAEAARAAALVLQRSADAERRAALDDFARALERGQKEVEAANAEDLRRAEGKVAKPLLDRLKFQGLKVAQAAQGVRALATLPDPVGRTLRATQLDDGLKLYQVTVPLGVIACAFESRPDAAVQVSALAMRTGNAVLLKGGTEAERSNAAIALLARDAVRDAGLPEDAVQLLEGREELARLLAMDDLVDLVIPRGSGAFVKHVQEHTRIPVMGHAEGVCHTYVDKAADLGKALAVCVDAKVDYPAACNATEAFLVHRDVAPRFVPRLVEALRAKGVRVFADPGARALAALAEPARPEHRGHEFGDLACSLWLVGSVEEAVDFVNVHGSKHTEAILTEDREAARRFVEGVDSAGVFVNASTRFADGFRYGLGAEVGVSTGKVHARGPVGPEGLVTTKWVLVGEGQTAAAYQGERARRFQHTPLEEEWHG